MKGLLARFGYGAATVRIDPGSEEVSPGDSLAVEIEVEGGSAAQTADLLYAKVSATTTMGQSIARSKVPEYPTKSTMRALARATGTDEAVDPALEYTIDVFEVAEGLTIDPGERWTATIDVRVPHATPLTMGGIRAWVGGKMKVLASRNPASERHYVDVVPDERFRALFDALEAMGMAYGGTKLDGGAHAHTPGSPFVDLPYPMQLFRFYPREGPYAADLDAVDVWALGTEDGMEVDVRVDPGPGEKTTVAFEGADADAVRAELEAAIDRT